MSYLYQQYDHRSTSTLSLYSSTAASDLEMEMELMNLKPGDGSLEIQDQEAYKRDESRSRTRCAWTTSDDEARRPSMSGWISLVGLTGLMAGSMVLNVQAILHFQNITTLVMLSMLSYLVKLVILDRSRLTWLRCAILAISCAGILYGEYRLLVAGLLTSIPAALLAGLAGALYSIAADRLPDAISDPRRINILFCCSGLAITSFCAFHAENTLAFQNSLELKYMPTLAVNAFTTAMAILIGKSFLLPIDMIEHRRSPSSRNKARIFDAATVLALSGVVGCATTLMLRRSYTTYLQLFAFFTALFCVGRHSLLNSLHGWSWGGRRGYALLASPGLESMDSENTLVSGDTGATRAPSTQGCRKNFLFRSLAFGLLIALLWVVFPVLNFQERLYVKTTKETPELDLEYIPTVLVELVISMYKEPVDDVSFLISTLRQMPSLSGARAHIYIKDRDANVEEIKHLTGADKVTMLPNVGRESETYLYHILNEWDSLAKHTIFLQADVHNPREFYPRIRDYYDPERTGMMSLGFSGNVCNCNECGDRWSWWDTTRLFPEIHSRIYNNSTACDRIILSYKGQFIASANRIRGIDKTIYEDLRTLFVDEKSWAHQEEYLQGRQDSMSAPVFGYTMERMWNLLLQCSSTDVAWKCPTLLSGGRIGGSIEDCQCFDPRVREVSN
ncbi:hypothetical protein K505DRAFT_400200 [Melanomma pulvis-pyrius CBS 109.77]|uniref:Uncharacterized protein n=1 Tax=Melanomma pulvis-pyrius CBS 109.77 TaxID=1314802 RepID=A0A6A6WPL9_9PLEO|nr:hypothetical protein K505DRAFT_400200 [Melanomma pulvis-pyrius CBS 109.77]